MKLFRSIIAQAIAAAVLITAGAPIVLSAALTKSPANMQANDVSTLSQQLTAAATSMTLNPVKKWINGVKTTGCFNTGSGFLLVQDSLGRTEWVSFGAKSCSATFYSTLSDLRRGLSPVSASFNAGTGLAFDAGASVRVIDYPIVYNYTLKRDLVNVFTGSGQLTSDQVNQAFLDLNCVTTAQRDTFTNVSDGNLICNSTTGTFQQRIGGSWADVGNSATANATTIVGGKVEMATNADIQNRVLTGDSGAQTVIGNDQVTRTSTGSTQANKVTALGANGVLSGTVLATNYSATTATGTYFLNGNQQLAIPSSSFYFGTCADGDVSIGTGTTVVLAADKYYNNLTVYSNATLKTGGYRIFVCGTLKMVDTNAAPAGKIINNGTNGLTGGDASGITAGTGGAGGTPASGGTLPVGKAGVAGGEGGAGRTCNSSHQAGLAGVAGTTGNAETVGVGTAAVAGGAGGIGGRGDGGDPGVAAATAGGTAGATSITDAKMMFNALLQFMSWATARDFSGSASAGGGSGGGGGAAANGCASGNSGAGGGGGGSGSPGGNIDLYANILTGSGFVQANGGNGGNGGAGAGCGGGSADGGGGGGGAGSPGNGGIIALFYKSISAFTGTIQALAGTVGTVGAIGSTGCTNASLPTVGSAVSAAAGQIFQYQVR